MQNILILCALVSAFTNSQAIAKFAQVTTPHKYGKIFK